MISNLGSFLVDKMIQKQFVSRIHLRKLVYVGGMLLTVTFFNAATFVPKDKIFIVVLCMSLSSGFSEIARSCVYVNITEVAPNFCGILCGIGQTFGFVAMFMEPLVTGYFTQEKAGREEYRLVFAVAVGVATVCSLVFAIFGKGDQQDWDKGKEGNFDTECDEQKGLIDSISGS